MAVYVFTHILVEEYHWQLRLKIIGVKHNIFIYAWGKFVEFAHLFS
jgi:hypothetical protein